MSIGANIRERRLARCLTQKELAELVGVDQSMVCQMERGTKVPTLPLGKQLADVLGCSLDDLLTGST